MTWKFDNKKLANELSDSVGYVKRALVDGDVIMIAQIATGERILSVEEFLEICELLDEEPARYIEWERE